MLTNNADVNWLNEIEEQPEFLLQAMKGRVSNLNVTLGGLYNHLEILYRSSRLILVACGSSYHACLGGKQLLEELTDIPVAVEVASDFMDRKCPISRNETYIFLSQSGETIDTLHALRYAKSKGALCVGVTNTVDSSIARETDSGVYVNINRGRGVSTKSYTSNFVVLCMVALQLSADRICKSKRRQLILDGLCSLPSLVRQTLKVSYKMKQLADKMKNDKSVLLLGRGFNYATVLEGSLTIKTIAMHAEGIMAGEMKHGPLALVDNTFHVIVIATKDSLHTKMLSVVHQLIARDARIIVICNEGDSDMAKIVAKTNSVLIHVPLSVDCLQPIINIIPLQLLAYHLSIARQTEYTTSV